MNSEAVFEQLKKNRKSSLNWQAGWLAGWLDEWIARKQKLSRRRDYSAKSGLVAWYFDPRWAFKAKVGSEDETARGVEIKQQEAVRQSTENIARIAPTGSFEVVEKGWNCIIAGRLKQKLRRV
jgi:hypothetical protein